MTSRCLLLTLLFACTTDGRDPCEKQRDFFADHRSCRDDADCVIVGVCTGGFGLEAVQLSVQQQAQAYADDTACAEVFDGPTYNAVCETGQCKARNRGRDCGVRPDAGGPLACADGEEIYVTDCPTPTSFCARRCTGPADTRCRAGLSCKDTTVSEVALPYGLGCSTESVQVWLCTE